MKTLYPSAKFDSFIRDLSVNRSIIIDFVSNVGTVTRVLSCNLTVIFFGLSACVLNECSSSRINGFCLYSFDEDTVKSGDEVYSSTSWHMSSNTIARLARCVIIN